MHGFQFTSSYSCFFSSVMILLVSEPGSCLYVKMYTSRKQYFLSLGIYIADNLVNFFHLQRMKKLYILGIFPSLHSEVAKHIVFLHFYYLHLRLPSHFQIWLSMSSKFMVSYLHC